ncbi:hypothetical protein EB796_020341 [Bugula neritina]|uniref:Uncharacterized protein n=1 Tax=Bugula neritina TaxID=10212 RepID=A0A7J7J574_BUGNE|nr:hypothetical protein EB796_020341 [Bugula neritina]
MLFYIVFQISMNVMLIIVVFPLQTVSILWVHMIVNVKMVTEEMVVLSVKLHQLLILISVRHVQLMHHANGSFLKGCIASVILGLQEMEDSVKVGL